MNFNQAKLAAAVEPAKARAAANVKWIRAIERAATALQNGELIVTTLSGYSLGLGVRPGRGRTLQLFDGQETD
jgi:hypothetical protein